MRIVAFVDKLSSLTKCECEPWPCQCILSAATARRTGFPRDGTSIVTTIFYHVNSPVKQLWATSRSLLRIGGFR
jgi:hypothetical protein